MFNISPKHHRKFVPIAVGVVAICFALIAFTSGCAVMAPMIEDSIEKAEQARQNILSVTRAFIANGWKPLTKFLDGYYYGREHEATYDPEIKLQINKIIDSNDPLSDENCDEIVGLMVQFFEPNVRLLIGTIRPELLALIPTIF